MFGLAIVVDVEAMADHIPRRASKGYGLSLFEK